MITIERLIGRYDTLIAASLDLRVSTTQLARWRNSGAQIDAQGAVWIKTKSSLGKLCKDIEGVEL